MPSPAEVDALKNILLQLAQHASGAIVNVLTRLGDEPEAEQILETVYPRVVDPYIQAAGQVSEQWYAELDPGSGFAVKTVNTPDLSKAMAKSVRWAFTQTDPQAALLGATERRVFDQSRDTIASNAHSEGVKYARGASATACAWCRLQATRGAVFRSEQSAIKGHDRCHCVPVPDRPGSPYVPPEHMAAWDREYARATKEVGTGDKDDIVNWMRRHEGGSSAAHKADLAGPDIVLDGVHYTPAQMRTNALKLFDDAFAPSNQGRTELLARKWGPEWYPQTRKDLDGWREGSGLNHTQASGIMSVLSGNTSYTNNVVMTKRYFDGASTAKQVGTSSAIMDKVNAIGALKNPTRNEVMKIVAGKDAPKQVAFFLQLDGVDSAAVIDVHQVKVMLGLPKDDEVAGKLANRARGQTGAYDKMAAALVEAAADRGVLVGMMQATCWIEFRGTPF